MGAPGFPSRVNHQFTWKDITAGDYPVRSESGVLLAGQVQPEGAVLGKITDPANANKGKFVLSLAAATDGSQVPCGILAYDVDASAGDTACESFVSGDYDQGALTYGAGHTADTVKAAFEGRPIFLKHVAGGVEIGGDLS